MTTFTAPRVALFEANFGGAEIDLEAAALDEIRFTSGGQDTLGKGTLRIGCEIDVKATGCRSGAPVAFSPK
jgi:hypothetical protein